MKYDDGVSVLYQIGIRCLAATRLDDLNLRELLYQIGIRCLAATKAVDIVGRLHYIKLELDV